MHKMAELIKMPFGLWTWVDPRNHVPDEGPDPPMQRGNSEVENVICMANGRLKETDQQFFHNGT